MKIKTVEYSALFNLGDYNNERIGFTVQLDEGETPEQVIESLRKKAIEQSSDKGMGGIDGIHNRIYSARFDLRSLERKLKQAQDEWNSVAEFLRAQGIKPDAPNLTFKALMPSADSETVIEGELEDELF